ncbi:hypothetical protein AKJ47_02250 [candidate division MSBL1 archaeon SCGC-AAA261G05]|uniref:Type-4 uracil-DNA glycosylase n=1 Tax=candidate division MSBL1 archaeon SCGC-AAA261G05 TaxID=1698276 RepID=A0A133VAJ4_9EURY|nr:hypothetical protein AKJ47_02250 [candidate division MSBL1 archaeon SCGC-AAA261G05]
MEKLSSGELDEKIRECTLCDLHKSRSNAVPGEGPDDADIMMIGEAPGYYEDQEGLPFVGSAGKKLDGLLEKAGLKRGEIFIGNVLKCRPPENRDPTTEEIETCRPYLERQIRTIKPKLIVALGRFAGGELLGKSVSVSREHGELRDSSYGGWHCKLFISYHPAAALYGADAAMKLEEDFEKLGEVVEKLDEFKTAEQTTL